MTQKALTMSNVPALTPEGSLSRYLQEIRKFPMLEPEEEYMLAKSWVEASFLKLSLCGSCLRAFGGSIS